MIFFPSNKETGASLCAPDTQYSLKRKSQTSLCVGLLCLILGLRYCNRFWSCNQCVRTRRFLERERVSAPVGSYSRASISFQTSLQCCFWPPWWGGAVHTLSRPCLTLFSLLTPTQVTVSMLVEQEVCFYTSVDGPFVVVLVSRVVVGSSVFRVSGPDPLVELCHWLQGVGTEGAGDLEVT